MFQKKKKRYKLTHLSSLLARKYRYLRVSQEINPSIRVILYEWDLSRQPCKQVIIKGLIGPSTTLSWQQHCPSTNRRKRGLMSSYHHSRNKTRNSFKEERE
jgi:hypothetical protein